MMTSYYRDDLTGLPEMGVVGDRLWRMSGAATGRFEKKLVTEASRNVVTPVCSRAAAR